MLPIANIAPVRILSNKRWYETLLARKEGGSDLPNCLPALERNDGAEQPVLVRRVGLAAAPRAQRGKTGALERIDRAT